MVNYQLGKIYKIVDLTSDMVYVGSTCEKTLAKRLAQHVGTYKCYLKGIGNFVTSYKIIENGNYDIVLIEAYPCDSKDELHKRERHYIDTIECVNKSKPIAFDGEKEISQKEYNKKYYETNKQSLKDIHGVKIKCTECGKEYTKWNASSHKKTGYHLNAIKMKELHKNTVSLSSLTPDEILKLKELLKSNTFTKTE